MLYVLNNRRSFFFFCKSETFLLGFAMAMFPRSSFLHRRDDHNYSYLYGAPRPTAKTSRQVDVTELNFISYQYKVYVWKGRRQKATYRPDEVCISYWR